jgi:NAD(P)-dependent dehydrogenase (short-subunit alcohol dehydrogenase family)
MLLSGKTAVISGAASPRGIGLATARLFAQHGARVAILDLDEAGAQRAAAELGPQHRGFACDVANLASCQDAARQVIEAFGAVDILINNAGITQPVKTMEITPEDLHRIMVGQRHPPHHQQQAPDHAARGPAGPEDPHTA